MPALLSWSCIQTPWSFCNCMMVFFLKVMVAMAWKNLVHSPPNLILFSVYLFFQYVFIDRSRAGRWVFKMFLRLCSGLYRVLSSSKASRCRMTVLQLAMKVFIFENCLLQFLRLYLSRLNFVERTLAASVWWVCCIHESWTISWKLDISAQKFSKRKNTSSGDLCVNDNLVGDVIRRYLRNRNNLRIRIGYCPIHRSKKPV